MVMENILMPPAGEASCWSAVELLRQYKERKSADFQLDIVFLDFLVRKLQQCRLEKATTLQQTDEDSCMCLSCNFCIDLLNEPVTLPCGHTFCRFCIAKREKEDFIELCFKCDENGTKIQKKIIIRRSIVQSLSCDVTLSSILLMECFNEQATAKKVRMEGNILFATDKMEEAEEKYFKAVKLYPYNFSAWSNLSNLKLQRGEYEASLEFANRTIIISPLWCKGYYRQGAAYKALKRFPEAAQSFLKYLILEPHSPSVKTSLLEILQHLNKEDDKMELEGACPLLHLVEVGLEFCLNSTLEIKTTQRTFSYMENILQKMEVELTCALCCRIYFKPTTTPCGHTFCTSCLERCLDYSVSCSICRHSIQELITVRPKPVNVTIAALVRKFFPKDQEERETAEKSEKEIFLYDENDEVTIPIFVCGLGLPLLDMPLHIFEPRYKLLVRRCHESKSKMFGNCMYDPDGGYVNYGTMLEINNKQLLTDGRLLIETRGGRRFQVLEKGKRDGYNTAKIRWIRDEKVEVNNIEELAVACYEKCRSSLDGLPRLLFFRIRIEFGVLPAYDSAELGQEYGPQWVWWMIRLLTEGSQEEANRALQSTSVSQRFDVINSKLHKLQQLSGNA